MSIDWSKPVWPTKVVAIATDPNIAPRKGFADSQLSARAPVYGQDIEFGVGRPAPRQYSVGTTEADLKPRMEKLLRIFASKDKTGMATRLFKKFLTKQTSVTFFEDADLNAAAANHHNINYFIAAAHGAPFPAGIPPQPGTVRIHQALRAANWDITRLVVPTDLGVPAFNTGSKGFGTGDFANGLGVMVNGVQHVYVLATHYHYDSITNFYGIKLRFLFYDVFGLDDDDLLEYGADKIHSSRHVMSASDAEIGITAWWQLQHQFGYAPLVTRIVVERSVLAMAL